MEKNTSNIKPPFHSWVACYITLDSVHKAETELSRNPQYQEVEMYVPFNKVFDKRKKNKDVYKKVPMLFNYGFVRVPVYFLHNPEFLYKLKSDVSAIYSWVKDPAISMFGEKPLKVEDHVVNDNPADMAVVRDSEIEALKKFEEKSRVHSKRDIKKLKPGSIIILRNKPWDGIPAKILKINKSRKKVKVDLLLGERKFKAELTFDQVLFTIYNGTNLPSNGKEICMTDWESENKQNES